MLTVVILSVRPSVRLSVTRVLCDKTKQCTADILISHDKAITLVLTVTVVGGQRPFRLKFALSVTHPLRETPT